MFQVVPNNRRSHHRLTLAIGLSTILVTSLLTVLRLSLIDQACRYSRCSDEPNELVMHLEQRTSETDSEIALPGHERRPVAQETNAVSDYQLTLSEQSEIDPGQDDTQKSPREQASTRDWYAIAGEPLRQTIENYFDNEETRKKMWRQTGSVMFKDTGEFDLEEPETMIAAREFRRPVGVLGVGFTIGGCFFGIPLAGIPVEERSAGPNILYCTDIYE